MCQLIHRELFCRFCVARSVRRFASCISSFLDLPRNQCARINLKGFTRFVGSLCGGTSAENVPEPDTVGCRISEKIKSSAKFEAGFVFSLFDYDEDGLLEMEVFKEICFFFLGTRVPMIPVKRIWARIDSDKDGYASKHEFVEWLTGITIDTSHQSSRILQPKTSIVGSKKGFHTLFEVYLHMKRPLCTTP